jgi:hypothetical protein
MNVMLPFKKVKGEYFNALDSNRWDDRKPSNNHSLPPLT